MKSFIQLIGIILFCSGIILGIYVGFWLMLVDGFVMIINTAKSVNISGSDIGIGLIKVIFSRDVGLIIFQIFSGIAMSIFASAESFD